MMKQHYIAKRMIQDGILVGYRLFTKSGLFGQITFKRYLWL